MPGVEVTTDGYSATTAGDGTYTMAPPAPGAYTVTPTLTEYTFAPSDAEVTLTAGIPEVTGVDFVGTQKTYSIAGTIVDEEDNPLEGVAVTIDGRQQPL